jgi:hypothetical protein
MITGFANGVRLFAQERVPRSDAALFMRALLEPLNATHYGFVDESDSDTTSSDQESR